MMMMNDKDRDRFRQRFLAKYEKVVAVEGPLETLCLEWSFATDSNGYGLFCFNYRDEKAHRAAWLVFKGEIPPRLFVLHRCDRRACVNIDHLFLGRGVLTDETAAKALQLLNEGREQIEVAHTMGVSKACIRDLYNGRTWTHVPGPRQQRTYQSRHRGIRRKRGRWAARCTLKDVTHNLGSFAFEADAAVAYNYFAAYHGLDRPLNQITLEEWNHD